VARSSGGTDFSLNCASQLEEAGLAPAFLLPRPFNTPALQPDSQQTVDGLQGALEIGARSSYVPNSPIGVRSAGPAVRA